MNKHHPSNDINQLLRIIDESYERRAWHGTNLRGSLRGLTLDELCWRPAPARHNIWEIALHCAYWKYIVRRRLLNEKKGSFPLKGSNWFKRPVQQTARAWKEDLRLLEETHRLLCEAVKSVRTSGLTRKPRGSTWTNRQTISGIASHDLYHAGQIQLLKRLQRN